MGSPLPSDNEEINPPVQKISGKMWGRVLQFRKLRQFPFSVFFIVATEICERFATRGSLRAVLVLYLNSQLMLSRDRTTVIYHLFITFSYILTIIGALISDSCLGKYWTILILSSIYTCGNILLAISAIPFQLQINIALAMLALVIIMFGMGGIKSCVAAFGGDQFKEDQKELLSRFFSLFYFAINVGAAVAGLLIPVLRSSINCFGTDQCFIVAIGLPSILMIVSIVIFVAGTKFYTIRKPNREAVFLFFKFPASVVVAIYCRLKRGKSQDKKHLLQYADHRFSRSFVDDVRLTLRVLMMMLPLSVWWSLYDQQGSRWTLQATRMNGRLGHVVIQPDQLYATNPMLLLILIPIFETIIYPLFAKCKLLKRLLQRMVTGMTLAVLAFIMAGILELQVEAADTTLKPGEGKAIFTNTLPETVQLQLSNETMFSLTAGESYSFVSETLGNHSFTVEDCCSFESTTSSIELVGQFITHVYITADTLSNIFIEENYREEVPAGVNISVHVVNGAGPVIDFFLCENEECDELAFVAKNVYYLESSNHSNISSAMYYYRIQSKSHNWTQTGKLQNFGGGAIYSIVLANPEFEEYNATVVEVTAPNQISILLQVPMYIVMTASEVLVSISAVEFAYSQAPTSMKAICQTTWLWTTAFGNIIVIIIAELNLFPNQAIEFFFFAGLLTVVIMLYTLMSYFYKYVDVTPSTTGETASDALSSEQDRDDVTLLERTDEEAIDTSLVESDDFTPTHDLESKL